MFAAKTTTTKTTTPTTYLQKKITFKRK